MVFFFFLLNPKIEQSTTPVSKASSPTSRSDAPKPSSTVTPALRSAPGKPKGAEAPGKCFGKYFKIMNILFC